MNALAYSGEAESAVLLEEQRTQPGLTMFTDGSWLDDGVTRYAVVWRDGRSWLAPRPTWAIYNQEAYDAERAALASALETASRGETTPERVTIFTDAQAAIRRMASEEPGPGQMHTLQVRKQRPDIIEIR